MDWMRILRFILDAKGFDDKVSKVKAPLEAAKKVSKKKPSDLSWDDVKHFNDKTMNAAILGVRQLLAVSEKAEKIKLELPASDKQKLFVDMFTAARKYGPQSPQCNKARLRYLAALRVFDSKLKLQIKSAVDVGPKLERSQKQVKAMIAYGDLLSKFFLSWAKNPTLGSSARQAQMLGLSENALQYSGLAGSLGASMQRLRKKNATFTKLCAETIKINQLWINETLKASNVTVESLKKNLKAVKPKR